MVQEFQTQKLTEKKSSDIFSFSINEFLHENKQCCSRSRSFATLSSSRRSNSSSSTSLTEMNRNDVEDLFEIEVADLKPKTTHKMIEQEASDTKVNDTKAHQHHLNSISNTIRDLMNELVDQNKVAVIDEDAVVKSVLSWTHSLSDTPSPLYFVSRMDLLQWIWDVSTHKRNKNLSTVIQNNIDDILQIALDLYVIEASIISQTNSVYLEESKLNPVALVHPTPILPSNSLSEAFMKLTNYGLASIPVVRDLDTFQVMGILYIADLIELDSDLNIEISESFAKKWPTVGDFLAKSDQDMHFDSPLSMILPIDATVKNAIQLILNSDCSAAECPAVWIVDESKHLKASLQISDILRVFEFLLNNDEMQIKSSLSSLMIQDNIVNESTLNSIGISGGGIFSLDKVQFNFPNNSIIDFDVENNILVVACGSGSGMILIKIVERPGTRFVFPTLISHVIHSGRKLTFQGLILWIDLDKPNSIVEIPIPGNGMIESIYLSPLAKSLVISLTTGENYFYYPSGATSAAPATGGIVSPKPKLISKIKGRISAVAWPSASSRGSILIGTKGGAIFDLEVSNTDSKKIEKSCVQVFSGQDEICGIHYTYMSCGLVVYIATTTFLYQFIGPRDTVSAGSILVDPSTADIQEVPGDRKSSCLILHTPHLSVTHSPSSLSWLTGPGIYTGSILSSKNVPIKNPGDSSLDHIVIVPYPTKNGHEIPIISMAITEFHYILLGEKECMVINRLDNQMQYTLPISLGPNEKTLGLVSDSVRKTYWVSTNQNLYEIIVTDEDRDIWKIYFERKQYKEAMAVAKSGDSKAFIAEHYATQSLKVGDYNLAAELYARTKLGIEEVSLRLLRLKLDTSKPLLTFLSKRMALFRENEDKSQTIMIGSWILELLLSDLDFARDKNRLGNQPGSSSTKPEAQSKEINSIIDSIYSLMKTYKNRLHSPTVYSLLKQHGNQDLQLYYAELIQDYSRICDIHISNQNWEKSLQVIGKQPTPSLLYKHSPILILHIPLELVRLWKRCGTLFANPRLLLPSMLCYEIKQREASLSVPDRGKNEIMLFLEYVIKEANCTDRVIHNYLLYLYVTTLKGEEREKTVMEFIKSQNPHGAENQVYFDIQYALRICQQYQLLQACVQLYLILEMQKEAVSLALKSKNLNLAKEIVESIEEEEEEEEIKKQLWLQIVKYVIRESKDMKKAMELGKEGNLKLEQILPLFPDFVQISEVKQDLVEAIQSYKKTLDYLSKELDESANTSDLIRADIRSLQGRSIVISGLKKCDWCKRGVLTRQFHVFPCHHAFHSDCIVSELLHYPPKSPKVKYLQSQLSESNPKAREDFERFVGEECILCGDIMIRTIDIPLVDNIDML